METAWKSGRLDASHGPHRLLFGNMYEDAAIEEEAFRGRHRVFCIASAGSTAFRLSAEHEVIACDINPVQLAYAERRAHGGPPEKGDAERAMGFARSLMPLVGWRQPIVRAFLDLADGSQQFAFWKRYLDTRRFRLGLDLVMSRIVLQRVYSPHLLSALPTRFGGVLRKRLERTFARHPNATNPYARALLLGDIQEHPTACLTNLTFVCADAAGWLESCPANSFDAFTLSNILDGADSSYRGRLSQAVRRTASDDAVVVSFAEPHSVDQNIAERDRSMLWGVVDVRSATTF